MLSPLRQCSYVKTENDASTTVNGTIKSADSTAISADAKSEIVADASTTTTTFKGNLNLVNVALLLVDGKNTSHVTIGQDAKLQEGLNGNVHIASTATNSLTATAHTSAKDTSAIATAVNITKYESDAQTKV